MALHAAQELAHYALATTDLLYRFPFGWEELWGVANRGSFDLEQHSKASGEILQYRDDRVVEGRFVEGKVRWHVCTDAAPAFLPHFLSSVPFTSSLPNVLALQTFFPHAVEPAVGLNRLFLALMCDGLHHEATPNGGEPVCHSVASLSRRRLKYTMTRAHTN